MNLTGSQNPCLICTVISSRGYIERTEHGIIFLPDDPIVAGHTVAASLIHVEDALANPTITAQVIRLAAMKSRGPCSIVIPVGSEVGQIYPHMYVDIVPAEAGRIAFQKSSGGKR